MKQKNSILIIAVVVIVGAIAYLEINKPKINTEDIKDIVVTDSTATSTDPDLAAASSNVATTTSMSTGTTATSNTVSDRTSIRAQKASKFPRAKEFVDTSGFVNTPPFTLSSVVGKKVVLLDIWTYSCINCLRTIPYLKAWNAKYKDFGLEIIGVHTPEFDFEKDIGNVTKATKDLGVSYKVVLDNNKGTWNAYGNQYWPREYLIDIDGFIAHDKIGEGGYADTEREIQKALQERQVALGLKQTIPTTIVNPADVIAMDQGKVGSPEIYFGASRNSYLGNATSGSTGTQNLTLPASFTLNTVYLAGTWNFSSESAQSTGSTGTMVMKYNAKNVYMVGSAAEPVTVKVYKDGAVINTVTIKDNKLYTLIEGSDYGQHDMKLEIQGSGLQAFTFTFG